MSKAKRSSMGPLEAWARQEVDAVHLRYEVADIVARTPRGEIMDAFRAAWRAPRPDVHTVPAHIADWLNRAFARRFPLHAVFDALNR